MLLGAFLKTLILECSHNTIMINRKAQEIYYVVYKRIHREGFAVYDSYHLFPKFLDLVLPYIREGKIAYVEDIAEGSCSSCRNF